MLSAKNLQEIERISPTALCALVRDLGKSQPIDALNCLIDSAILVSKPKEVGRRMDLIDECLRLRAFLIEGSSNAFDKIISDSSLVTKKAILGLLPMCDAAQKTEMLMHCIRRKSISDVAVCLDAGVDPLSVSNSNIEFIVPAAPGIKVRRIELLRVTPYALMLKEFDSKQWSLLERMHPSISMPINRIPVLAEGGNNGLPHDRKPVDMVSLCFALDLGTTASQTAFRRDRLTRVLKRLEGAHFCAKSAKPNSIQIKEVLEELGNSYVAGIKSSEDRDKCLMLAQVVMIAGDASRPWVQSIFKKTNPSSAEMLLHDLARLGSSNLLDDADRSLVVGATRRLVDLGFCVDLERSNEKITPLMDAAACGHLENMAALIEMGANLDAKDARGHTARIHAKKKGMFSSVAFLDAHQSRLAINAALPTLSLPFV